MTRSVGEPLTVFPDTNALLAMLCFPTDAEGRPTLAGEVKALYGAGAFELVINQTVAWELREVIARTFPQHREIVDLFLKPFEASFTRWPTPDEVQAARPYAVDIEDAPIFAAAVLSEPDVALSNDFETFHTDQAKRFWAARGIQVESLYGLLCLFGRRERQDSDEAGLG